MPSILNVSGFPRTARPNVYTKVDASALAGGAVDSGNIAIVGDFPTFPSADPVLFGSRRAFVAYDSENQETSMLAQLCFNPSADPNTNLGASSVRVINSRVSCTQATINTGALTLKSTVYGTRGNGTRATISVLANNVFSIILDRGGISESYNVQGGDVATFTNNTGGNIQISCVNGVFAIEDVATSANLITLTSNEARDLRSVVTQVNQLQNLSATLIEARSIPLDELDYFSETVSDAGSVNITANNQAVFSALALSALVDVEIDTTASGNSDPSDGTLHASSGSEGATLDVDTALASIENENVQIVVLMDYTEGNQSLLKTHLDNSAKAGFERQAYVAIEQTSNLTAIKARASLLNRPDIALTSQGITLFDSRGLKVTKDSRFTALMLAGMQAGSDVGEPLTRKKPSVLSTTQNFNTHNDAETALRSGTIFISQGATGLRVERSITTYLEDNNPILSEISAYESVLTSLRDMRTALNDQIGRPTKASQMGLIESRVTARLSQQVRDGMIKAFGSITLEDLGDQVAVSYDMAPVEPLNFITLTAIAQRNI